MSTELEYRVEYEVDTAAGCIVATIPELGHVSTYGSTFAEAEANVRDAALGYLEALQKQQKTLPAPIHKTEGTYLRIFVPRLA